MPESLRRRPRDRRGYPIPYVQAMSSDGTPDFTAVDAGAAWAAGSERRCGLCGESMGYWVAFVGGPLSAAQRMFLDPPMHPECATAAMRLCPHMAQQHLARASRTTAEAPPGFVAGKPAEWVVYETRSYTCEVLRRNGQLTGYVFKAAPPKRLGRWVYDRTGTLVPSSPVPAAGRVDSA